MSIEFAPHGRGGRAIFVLIPLLILHLTLISLQVEDPAGVLLFKRWVLLATSPFFNVSSLAVRGVTSAWRSYVWLHGAREENQRLQQTVIQMALRDSSLAQVKEENSRLHRLLALDEALPVKSIGAHIVGRSPSFLSNLMIIDRGAADGVRVDSGVMSADGVLGRAVLVSLRSSQVQLISNPDAAIGVMLEKSRAPGVLKGTGTSLLDLHYLSNTERIEPGDKVITSGLDGIFPKGIPVGTVVDSRKGKSVFRVIKVQPSADLIHIEEVLVLTGLQKPPVLPEVRAAEN